MKNKLIFAILIFLTSGIYSCSKLHDWNQPGDPEVEYSVVWPLAGEWYVTYQFANGEGVIGDWYGLGYTKLFTYNTSNQDKDKFWVSDGGNFWTYTVKSPCNVGNRTFGGDSLSNTADYEGALYDIKVNIKNGKVLENAGHSTSGLVTDSIYFEIEFDDDPGTIYYCAGTRKTGFLEDEH